MKLIFFFLLTSLISFSQKELKDYSLNHSLKQDNEQFQFKVLDSDKHGVLIHRKNRFYFWYKAQKVMNTQGGSSGQLLHGYFESFYDNKQISKKGKFQKGLKVGEWLYWRMDGTLIRTEQWSKGRLVEMKMTYNIDGTYKNRIEYSKNKTRTESPDSIVINNLKSHKKTIYLKDSDGNIIRKENLKNNELNGWVKIYENAKVVDKSKYKKGVLIEKTKKEKEEKSGKLKSLFSKDKTKKEKKPKMENTKNTKEDKPEKKPKEKKEKEPNKEKPLPKKKTK